MVARGDLERPVAHRRLVDGEPHRDVPLGELVGGVRGGVLVRAEAAAARALEVDLVLKEDRGCAKCLAKNRNGLGWRWWSQG